MRILDRYLLNTFLAALGVFLVAFVSLFVVVDFASKLGRFLDIEGMAAFVARYYLVRLPMVLAYLLPTVVLFASIFTAIKLSRTNELLPIVAAGTSLRRVTLPFLVTGALSSGIMAALDEFVLPLVADAIAQTENEADKQQTFGVSVYDGQTFVYMGMYEPRITRMTYAHISRLDSSMRPFERIRAEVVDWDGARWVARRGTVEKLLEKVTLDSGRPRTPIIPVTDYSLDLSFTPEQVRKRSNVTHRLPFQRLSELWEEVQKYGHVPIVRIRFYSRLAFPLSPVILLLLGLPSVVVAQAKSYLKGLFYCFLLALAYYVSYFLCMELGIKGALRPPAAAVFCPTAFFGLAGVLAYARMRT